MEFVSGVTVRDCWDEMDEFEKDDVCQQVANVVEQFKSMELPAKLAIGMFGDEKRYYPRGVLFNEEIIPFLDAAKLLMIQLHSGVRCVHRRWRHLGRKRDIG